ncbi:copper resistance CopC family protein [Dictyobacter formicarum]|uniref:CopC domain-containing protein n=1 Tax=Dictyobacter formicarum TaxID=2778368 RepID=A0ABQ3VXI8_9CHLR|nr:copper resistance protein CopC [Dictyobacter formicarum]GHO89761.1 hypothetical protein KSZ_77670 [Dictyobacter formicarum]
MSTRVERYYLISFSVCCGMLCMLICTGSAFAHPAHGEYVSSVPATNAMLDKAPTMITVRFSEPINPNQSDIQVYDVNGKLVSTAPAKINGSDHQTMAVPMQANGSEIYLVNWHNASTDEGHRDSGSFRFFVNISPMLKGMVKGEMAGHPMMATEANTQNNTTALPAWLNALLTGIVGLLVGSAVTFALARRQQKHKESLPEEENTLGKK